VKPVTIYGIPNCDTMKKARAWLEGHGVVYEFHDYKKAGIDRERLEAWSKKVGWETLLNRAGTTFRNLPDTDKQGLDEKKAITLMIAQPSLIKRPVLDLGGDKLLVGFKPEVYAAAFKRGGSRKHLAPHDASWREIESTGKEPGGRPRDRLHDRPALPPRVTRNSSSCSSCSGSPSAAPEASSPSRASFEG
jgi:arsenate reductase